MFNNGWRVIQLMLKNSALFITRSLAAVFALAMTQTAFAQSSNYTDIWWAKGGTESGWGLQITDQVDQIFVTWYTYDTDGSQLFIVMSSCDGSPGGKFNRTSCDGSIYRTRGGSAITAATFNPAAVQLTKIGTATLAFTGNNAATWTYRVGTQTITKQIERFGFGTGFGNYPTDASNLYLQTGADGWGFSLAQHGNLAFGVIYHYDASGNPIFVVMSAGAVASNGTITGGLITTRSNSTANYLSPTWNSTAIQVTNVGNATLTPSAAGYTFGFTYNGASLSRPIGVYRFGSGSTGGGGGVVGGPTFDCFAWSPVEGTWNVKYTQRNSERSVVTDTTIDSKVTTRVSGNKWIVETTETGKAPTRTIYDFNASQFGVERSEGADGSYSVNSPVPYFPRSVTQGQVIDQAYRISTFAANNSLASTADVTTKSTIGPRETVTTPAGTFPNSCRVEADITTTTSAVGTTVSVAAKGPTWAHSRYSILTPLLRSLLDSTTTVAGMAVPNGINTMELISLEVNGVRITN
jgi:hypothetical protein